MAVVDCSHCGKAFEREDRLLNKFPNHYCSQKCGGLARRARVEVPCDYCGSLLDLQPSRVARSKHQFCGRECYLAWIQASRGELKCEWCGGIYHVKASKVARSRFCSEGCRREGVKATLLHLTCTQCGIDFSRPEYEARGVANHFCSEECRNSFRPTGTTMIPCEFCGKRVGRTPSGIHNRKYIYCSRSCMAKDRSEHPERNGFWKGGRFVGAGGYIRIKGPPGCPEELLTGNGYIAEHRWVMYQHRGFLRPSDQVHHLNGIKDDNRLENLVLLSPADHAKLGPTKQKLLQARIRELEAELAELQAGGTHLPAIPYQNQPDAI